MNWLKRFFYCVLGVISLSAEAQSTLDDVARMQSTPLVYPVRKIHTPMTIDGQDSEEIWSSVPWSNAFIDIEGAEKNLPKYKTQVKMVYDSAYLYIYARMEEPHVWGNITQFDDIIYHNNDFEVFMKPDVHDDHYYELEINPLNTVFDLAMSKPYRFGGKALIHWDIKDLKSAVYTAGTLNDPTDTDEYWGLEIAIPFQHLLSFGAPKTPAPDSYWMFNFSRVQWQHSIAENGYERKKYQGKILPEDNWVWSPIGLINMHFPERWGYIQFVEDDKQVALPSYHRIKQLGWNIHYLQKIHHQKHGDFATDMEDLSGYEEYITPLLEGFLLSYANISGGAADGAGYTLLIKDANGPATFYIDHLGNQKYDE